MEVKNIDREIFNWRRENKGEVPFLIEVHYYSMSDLLDNKDTAPHIQQDVTGGRIIGYTYKGIPLVINDDVKSYKFYNKQQIINKLKEERNMMWEYYLEKYW